MQLMEQRIINKLGSLIIGAAVIGISILGFLMKN